MFNASVICVESAKDRVIEVVQHKQPRPTELLDALVPEFSYQEIQDALSDLLVAGFLELNSDRHLQIARK